MAGRKGKLGTLEFRLAPWVPRDERYQRRYRSVDPQSETLSGNVVGLVADAKFRPWVVRDWSAGEGFDTWTRDNPGYRTSNGVVPTRRGDGLQLAQLVVDTTLSGSPLTGVVVLGIGQGTLWAVFDNDAYSWNVSSGVWNAAIDTGAANDDQATSIADGQDTWLYSGHESFTIRRWKSGSDEEHCANTVGFTWPPLLRAFGTRIFALDGDQLYEVDKTTPDTITQVADVDGNSVNWLANGPTWQRACTTDVGIAWIQRLDNGDTLIHEYNVAEDTHAIVGKVPVGWVWPYSIIFAFGFFFVGYRVASSRTTSGEGFVYFQRGQQRGVIGPIRDAEASPVDLAGVLGSQVMIVTENVFAYDVDTGGLVFIESADHDAAAIEAHAVVFGRDVFFVDDSSERVKRVRADQYQSAGTINLGWHDWDYPGLTKQFLDVTVITDPLPASTSVTAAVSADGSGTYTALTGTHDTDGATRFTFTVANPTSAPIRGQRFEVRLSLAGTSTATPVVREVSARAGGAQSTLEVTMAIDAGSEGGQTDEVLVAGLNALKTGQAPVTFEDPFQVREGEDPESFVVTVEQVATPTVESAADDESHPTAYVVVRGVSLV